MVSLGEAGVEAQASGAAETEGPHALNRKGVVMCDGRAQPVWDWVVWPMGK